MRANIVIIALVLQSLGVLAFCGWLIYDKQQPRPQEVMVDRMKAPVPNREALCYMSCGHACWTIYPQREDKSCIRETQ